MPYQMEDVKNIWNSSPVPHRREFCNENGLGEDIIVENNFEDLNLSQRHKILVTINALEEERKKKKKIDIDKILSDV